MALHGTDIYARNISGPRIALGGMPYTYSPFALLALLPTVLGSWRITYRIWCLAALLAVALTENVLVVRLIPLGSGSAGPWSWPPCPHTGRMSWGSGFTQNQGRSTRPSNRPRIRADQPGSRGVAAWADA
jgi:hypothetical protein